MPSVNFPASLTFTLSEEGGFADNAADPGGATMKGITLATYREFVPNATVDDLKAIPDFAVSFIYWSDYWREMKCDALPGGIDLTVFDFGVNVGPSESVRMLQRAVGVDDDGDLGPISMSAIGAASPSSVIASLAGAQKAYYQALPDFAMFGDGWVARTERRAVAALKIASVAA